MADPKQKANIYHRTVDLQHGCGGEVLREFMETKLDQMHVTLQNHMKKPKVRLAFDNLKPPLFKEQRDLIYPVPQEQLFDNSLLTRLLLDGHFQMTDDEIDKVKRLRKLRNDLSHISKPELEDDSIFTETSNLFHELAKVSGSTFEKKTKQKIADLQKTELVVVRSSIEIVKLRNEYYMVKLVESDSHSQKGPSDTTLLRYNITKWAKWFAEIVQVNTFMSVLKQDGVLSAMEISSIERHYNKVEQCNTLIMQIVDGIDENVLKFCRCLRESYKMLADLIETTPDDGADIESKLSDLQNSAILSAIEKHFEKDKDEKISTEDLHIMVEEELGYDICFSKAKNVLENELGLSIKDTSSVVGLKWRLDRKETLKSIGIIIDSNEDGNTISSSDAGFVDCSCEEFGDRLCARIETIKQEYGLLIRKAIVEECILPKTYSRLDENKLKSLFNDYMDGKKLIMGVMEELFEIQRELLDEMHKQSSKKYSNEPRKSLRNFDNVAENKLSCHEEIIIPSVGNLLVPSHEFRTLEGIDTSSVAYIGKECIRFICACLNTRKNGTIHFGVESIGIGTGKITGIRLKKMTKAAELDNYIGNAIESCFKPHYLIAVKRCIRPIQTVHINDNSIVLEMDVVPSSWYIEDAFFTIEFPPKGMQSLHVFVFTLEIRPEILSVPLSRFNETKALYSDNAKERRLLEAQVYRILPETDAQAETLRRRIAVGSKYITDIFCPIIFLGKVTGIENENEIRESIEKYMPDVFRSSPIIFEFDQVTTTQKNIEGNTQCLFETKTTADEDWSMDDKSCWFYCNGNRDISLTETNTNEWLLERSSAVKQKLAEIRKMIPQGRALLMFLFFDSSDNDSPMASIAEECMVSTFRNECIALASSEGAIADLKMKVLNRITDGEDFKQHFHSDMQWDATANVLKSVSKTFCLSDIQLPCTDGKIAYVTAKHLDRLQLTDIEILSGKQCIQEEHMDIDQLRQKKLEEKETFYRGENASWWNFHFGDQVGERDLYDVLLRSVQHKLRKNDNLIETETICHHPGAGGSTAGRYLIWNLSQFKIRGGTEGAFRCCVVKQISEKTADQIYDFMSFEDQTPKSAIILVDNLSEDSICLLRAMLDEKAYKRHLASNNVFCFIIHVRRVLVSSSEKYSDHLLRHQLSHKEQVWFEDKYKELENAEGIDVNTLISFNVMRNSFDKKYVDALVEQLLKDVKDVEIPILKCVSLVNFFDRDSVIPQTIFDYLLSGRLAKTSTLDLFSLIGMGPVGLFYPMMHGRSTVSSPWNTNVTEGFSLLTKWSHGKYLKTETGNQEYQGITMISQAVAKSVLYCIKEKEKITLPVMVTFLLQLVRDHISEKNHMSKEFIRIVNSLFKTRQFLTEEGDTKAKFSDMVMYLNSRQNSTGDSKPVVINLMKECISITQDAMVGQQLSRFYIYMKEYSSAEEEIKNSLEIQPKSSYLLDTYGQIFFSNMEHQIQIRTTDKSQIPDEDAVEIILLAFKAIEKFKEGQTISSKNEDSDNTSCYFMEIKTILLLLENFSKFSFYTDEKEFLTFLNVTEEEVPNSYSLAYDKCNASCKLGQLKRSGVVQRHADESLRLLEEKDYQLKRHHIKSRFYPVTSNAKDEKLLLKLRERFERFYGSNELRDSYKFKYGVGLKSLMHAREADNKTFKKRVDDAFISLQRSDKVNKLRSVDKRDLLALLGKEIIVMSEKGAESSSTELPMNKDLFHTLIRYSERLLEIEDKSQRPFLEAYLFYALLNWPSDTRESVENLCKPEKLKNTLKRWDESFQKNFRNESRKRFPKTYFALGNGPLGSDIVDFSLIEKKWRKTTGMRRQYVQDDQVWDKPFVRQILKRLEGTMNGNGNCIKFETKYQYWNYEFNIGCLQPCRHLCNRRVSFILVFTWSGPKAVDVKDEAARRPFDDDGPSSLESRDNDNNDKAKERGQQKPKEWKPVFNNGAAGKSKDKKKQSQR